MESYFTYENLFRAYLDCRRRKTNSLNHLRFADNLESNLLDLESQLQNRSYRPGRSIAFVVKRPKLREIFAADFRDRVVHHLLYNYLSPIFERFFIYDSWACRKGKGTHRAMFRLKQFVSQIERERERERVNSAAEIFTFKPTLRASLVRLIKKFFLSLSKKEPETKKFCGWRGQLFSMIAQETLRLKSKARYLFLNNCLRIKVYLKWPKARVCQLVILHRSFSPMFIWAN